jgi:hypothetical protein
MKYFLAMTSIPSRINDALFLDHVLHLQKQSIPFEKLFITLPKKYRRFEATIDPIVLEKLASIAFVEILYIEQDYGPASKFLGPFLLKFSEIKSNVLIVIDDDRFYHYAMVEKYQNFFIDHPNELVASGNPELYFRQQRYLKTDSVKIVIPHLKYVSGFMSFALRVSDKLLSVADYSIFIIKHCHDAFFHDEGILLNFMTFSDISVYYINFPFVNVINQEMNDALCMLPNINRINIEEEIRIFSNKCFPKQIPAFKRKQSIIRLKNIL